jgi:hypothetical protein
MCGNDQYYKASPPTGKKCDFTWTLTPSSNVDYDLYVKRADCPSTSNSDCSSIKTTGKTESCTISGAAETVYALAHKFLGTGDYSISVSISNCVDAGCKACGYPTTDSCWRKMKNSNCNDIDWYDFTGFSSTGRACGIKTSQEQHYDVSSFIGEGIGYLWCPETETMWKGIDCSSYPSWAGSEGDVCKVWYKTGPTTYDSKQGNWDPDDNACIINCNGKRESTASDARDYCGSSGAGDSQCEQACGADPKCDEKNTLYDCGTNGKCTSDCTCCEASDSDGGEDYLVKGTTTGLVSSNNVLSCDTKTDYCWDSTTLVEYYVTSDKYLNWRSYSCSLRNDGKVRCIDGRCGCLYDSDCPPGGPNNLVKGKCDSPVRGHTTSLIGMVWNA